MTRRVTAALIGASLLGVLAYAQAPPQQAPPAAPPAATAGPAPKVAAPLPPPASETYTYQPDGRRDPFLNLLDTGSDVHAPSRRDGLATFSASEISVRGVMQSRGEMVAMIQGPDNKTYIVHQGEKLLDGTIKSIMSRGIVVDQQVNDPLSIVKHREVTKLLRSLEGGRE